jgi:monoamine oxidase|tara:strand:- start:4486 stop:6084 length:1599 start_codon:yes stop_codon:yes gene_type:complete
MFFFRNVYDVIIIGGGISGLFTAYKLSKTGLNILIIEKDPDFGGRVHTVERGGLKYECGAARFHDSHTKLLTLIDELKLTEKMNPLPKEIKYVLRGYKKNFPYKTDNELSLSDLLKNALKKSEDYPSKTLTNLTFLQYLTQVYDFETASFMKDAFGYDSEFVYLNADAAIEMFKEDLFAEGNYHVLDGGLSQIIKKLEGKLNKCSNVEIIKGFKVKEIFDDHILIGEDEYYFKNLVCAVPQKALKQFKIFKDHGQIDSVKPSPLLRIYAKYPTKNLWFKGLKRTTTDNHIRHIIPVDYHSGLIMISYTDGEYAKMWSKLHANGDEYLIKSIHKEIKSLFGIEPPKPEFVAVHYWNEGFHTWNSGYTMDYSYQKMLKPFQEKNIFVCGEAFSRKQGWIEGALESCYDILKILPVLEENGIEVEFDQELIEYDEDDEIVIKYMTIEEVLEEGDNELLIIEVGKEKRIYDVSNWIPLHPGGSAIFTGIEANMYYLTKELHKKSPTQLFKELHSVDIFEKYFVGENDFVKQVGILK